MEYIAPILPHVHLRGSEKNRDCSEDLFLRLGYMDAKAVGACAVLEMPNTTPALTSEKEIRQRMRKVRTIRDGIGIYHGIHIGLQEDISQVSRALRLAKNKIDVPGLSGAVKAYWVHSTGNMGILDQDLQRRIWEVAGIRGVNFRGAVMQHCEDESYFVGDFDYTKPISHSFVQNKGAELAQVMRQVRNASDATFEGTFYVCHVSNPDTIDFLNGERKRVPFNIAIETITHHEFLNYADYEVHGNRAKRNPPLRDENTQKEILKRVVEGKTDILGDDHAPHYIDEKDSVNPPSGDPAILSLPWRVGRLRELGINEEHLEDLLFRNANHIFDLGLEERKVNVEYRPELWNDYGWNPFSRVDGSTLS